MFKKSWAKRLAAGAAALLASSTVLAAPTTVDFETAFDLVGPTQASTFYDEQGFRFTPTGGDALLDVSSCALGVEYCARGNSSVYLSALNGASVTISAGRWFEVSSLDASFLPSPSIGLTGYQFKLSLSGTTLGGGTVSQLLELVENSALPGDYDFSSYTADPAMTHLTSLTLSACYFTNGACVTDAATLAADGLLVSDLQFAVDNLTMSIPEPSAAWLAALSLGALVATRRRGAH